MTVFPARNLVLAAVVLAALAHGLLFAQTFLAILAVATALVLVALGRDLWWLRTHAKQIHVTLDIPSSAVRGEPALVSVDTRNESDAGMLVEVRLLLPEQGVPNLWQAMLRVAPVTAQAITLRLQANIRGAYHFGDVYIRCHSPLRLLTAQRRIPHEHVCRVYPNIRKVKEYLAMRRTLSAVAPHVRSTPLRGIGSEFESLRSYEEGDDIRRIDWKATARLGSLITRNYEIEHFRNVVVLVDRGRLMAGRAGNGTKLDHAIDAALMVCGVALDGGDRAGLLVFDQEVLAYLPPRGELRQLQAVLESLYDLQPVLVESHFRRAFIHLQTKLTRRSLVLVLSDVMDVHASQSALQGLLALGKRHLVVFAALRTPEIEEAVDLPDSSDLGPFRKAVAHRLLQERTEVLARLDKGGVHVLDVRPADLTVPLVNKYIELRERNLL